MAFLQGPGTAWFDDLRLTVAAASPTALEAASRPATVRLPLPQATSTQHPFDLTLDVTPSDRDGTATCTSTCDGLATCDGAATCEGETCDGSETCDASPTCAGYPTCGTTCEMT
jgi:hypothetical protein